MNKTAIKNFAIAARHMLIAAVTQRAHQYGVTENGWNASGQTETDGQKYAAAECSRCRQLLEHIRQNGFSQTMEEAAYTWFHHFTALRFLEVNGFLPGKIRVFTDENNVCKPEILAAALQPDLQENEKRYSAFLLSQCRNLHTILPEAFGKISGWMVLLFPDDLSGSSVILKMVKEIPEEDWHGQVQIIGWLYQYYNTEPKSKVFADRKKNIKIAASAIPAATQLFTPDWIVRYMVENSLGRLWMEGHRAVSVSEERESGCGKAFGWKFYLEEAEQENSVQAALAEIRKAYADIRPEQIRCIDPCMGAGHILVYAFDVLMDIYKSCGWTEQDAAVSILQHNLYGLDIDRRACQLANFALMMKARQYHHSIIRNGGIRLHLANFADAAVTDTSGISGRCKAFAEQFTHADIYGSLMEVQLPEEWKKLVPACSASEGICRNQLDMMRRIAEILSQKYDVVVTNPPYMGRSGMDAKLSDFVKQHYPDSKSDLFACFIEKCRQLAKPNGFYAMLTMHSWMFLLSFERLRNKLMQNDLINMLHLGANAFDQGEVGTIVQSAAFVFRNSDLKRYKAKYINLSTVSRSNEKCRALLSNPEQYLVQKEAFLKIPTHPYAYWASEQVFRLFSNRKLWETAKPLQGMTTSDNKRFTRRWYEVSSEKICFDAGTTQEARDSGKKWFPYNKGGGYRKWFGNHEYVVNYEDDGREMKAFHAQINRRSAGGRIKNTAYYFRHGIAWTFIALTPGFRYSPKGFIFDVAGSMLFTEDAQLEYVMAFLCSNVTKHFLRILNPTMNIQANDIKSLPFLQNENPKIKALAIENIHLCEADWDAFETSWNFEQHPLL